MNLLLDKIMACYLGKNIGGTLGIPHEGRQDFLRLNYYDPVPAQPEPNDDLDLQLVWLREFQQYGLSLNARLLGRAWLDHVDFHPDEYGTALANLGKGIRPPLSGLHNNYFTCGMGAAIRSELWASLFPGRPETAAYFAREDACVDHAGDGVLAEIYMAALESDLYRTADLAESLAFARSTLGGCRLAAAIDLAKELHGGGTAFPAARRTMSEQFGSPNVSDCVMNLGFVHLALRYGGGDFERSLLMAANCGADVDSTAASIASLLGILRGTAGIPDKWIRPIGRRVVLSSCIRGVTPPPDVETLAGEVMKVSAGFAGEPLPALEFPVRLPEVEDFSDRVLWEVNGRPMRLPGFAIDLGAVEPEKRGFWCETMLVSPETREVRLLVASSGLLKVYWDGEVLAQFGAAPGTMVPGFHRASGASAFYVRMEKMRKHRLSIDVFNSVVPAEKLYVGISDRSPSARHLIDVNWGLEPESALPGEHRRSSARPDCCVSR